jgi:hypothetical protein
MVAKVDILMFALVTKATILKLELALPKKLRMKLTSPGRGKDQEVKNQRRCLYILFVMLGKYTRNPLRNRDLFTVLRG